MWVGRENFKDSEQFLFLHHGDNENRANSELAAGDYIHAQIVFSIVAALHFPGLDAGSGQAGFRVQPHSKTGSVCSSGGSAYHFVSAAQSDGGAGGVGGQTGLLGDAIEQEIECQIGGQENIAMSG